MLSRLIRLAAGFAALALAPSASAQDASLHQKLRAGLERNYRTHINRFDHYELVSNYVVASRGCQTVIRGARVVPERSGITTQNHIYWNRIADATFTADSVTLSATNMQFESDRLTLLFSELARSDVETAIRGLRAACAGRPDEPSIYREIDIFPPFTTRQRTDDHCRFVFEPRLAIYPASQNLPTPSIYYTLSTKPNGMTQLLMVSTPHADFRTASFVIALRYPEGSLSPHPPSSPRGYGGQTTQVSGTLGSSATSATIPLQGKWTGSTLEINTGWLPFGPMLAANTVLSVRIPDPGGKMLTANFTTGSLDPRALLRETGLTCPDLRTL